jgi:hypothetical protein
MCRRQDQRWERGQRIGSNHERTRIDPICACPAPQHDEKAGHANDGVSDADLIR